MESSLASIVKAEEENGVFCGMLVYESGQIELDVIVMIEEPHRIY